MSDIVIVRVSKCGRQPKVDEQELVNHRWLYLNTFLPKLFAQGVKDGGNLIQERCVP